MAENQVILNTELRIDESKLRQKLGQLEQSLKFRGPFAGMTRDIESFDYQLNRATQRVITLGTAFGVLATASRVFRDIARSTVETEKALTDVNTIFKLTTDNVRKLQGVMFEMSKETATSFAKVATATQEFARQGLSVVETQRAVRAALLLSRDANIDVADSVKTLTAATNSFSKEALSYSQIVNRLATVDAAFAVSSKDLAEALTRVGSAAADAGVTFNQLVALVTSAQQISQRGGAVIAGALNTVLTRINRRDTLDALDAVGVAISDVRGQALPTIEVLRNFAVAYDKMTGSVKANAAEIVGGVRQLNILKANLQDLASNNSVFDQVQKTIERNTSEIERRNTERNQTLSALGSRFATTGQQIGSNIGQVGFGGLSRQFLKPILNNPITESLTEANGSAESTGGKVAQIFLKGFGSALVFGLGPILAKVLVSVSSKVISNVVQDIKAITQLNSEEKIRAGIEAEIVNLYQMGGTALQQQLATMTGITAQAAYLKTLLGTTGSGINVGPMAGAIMQQGYRGAGRAPRAAGGYIPYAEEAAAISAGVGGAPSTARPVLIPDFNFGGGKHGPIVANSSEFIVPHYAGGSAIFNREMAQNGLPPGAKPIAAGGYIPNAPGGYLPQELGVGWSQAGVQKVEVLNQLFANLAKAGTIAEASKFGPQILEVSSSLGELAQKRILKDVSAEFARIARWDYSVERYGSNPTTTAAWTGARKTSPLPVGFGMGHGNFGKPPVYGPFPPPGWTPPEMYGPNLPAGWVDPRQAALSNLQRIGRPSLFSRIDNGIGNFMGGLSGRLASPGGSLALGLGLPFLGAQVPEGPGGTHQGMFRGALSSGLSYGGSGAVTGGLVGGPGGVVPGLIIGTVVGAFVGAMSKATRSFEELASQVDQKNKSLNEDLTNALEVFRIQDDLINATESGNTERVKELQQMRSQQISRVKNKNYLSIINGGLNDPTAPARLAKEGNSVIFPSVLQGQLQTTFQPGEISFGSFFGGGQTSNSQDSAAMQAVTSVISKLSPSELTSLRKTALTSPREALVKVARMSGMDSKAIDEFVKTPRSSQFVQSAILEAVRYSLPVSSGASGRASQDNNFLTSQANTLKLATGFRTQAGNLAITSGADRSIDLIRQQVALSNPSLTESGRLGLTGIFGSQNIQSQGNAQRSIELGLGKGDLLEKLRKINTSQGTIDTLSGISSPDSLRAFRDELTSSTGKEKFPFLTNNEDFMKALSDLIRKLEELDLTTKENVRTNDTTNSILQQQLADSKTFGFASATDVGALYQAQEDHSTSVNQNDTPAVQRAKAQRQKIARMNMERRLGLTTQGAIDSEGLQFNMNEDLTNDQEGLAAFQSLGLPYLSKNKSATIDQDFARRQFGFQVYSGIPLSKRAGNKMDEGSLDLAQRISAYKELTGTAQGLRTDLAGQVAGQDLRERITGNSDAQRLAQHRFADTETQNRLKLEGFDLSLLDEEASGRGQEGDRRLRRAAFLKSTIRSSQFSSGSEISSGDFALAKEMGLQGDSKDSLLGGFHSVFSGLRRDMNDFADIGQQVAQSIQSSLGNAFGDFITGAKSAKNAFRDFAISVLNDVSRMLATKAVSSMLAFIPGFGGMATGGPVGMASGGMVQAMLTGGEFYVGPNAARRIGYDTLRRLNNGMAEGGPVMGGSGVRDDVPANLPRGSFIIKKSAAQHLGHGYLQNLVDGGVEHHGIGGILLGALFGGGLGYAVGGKKGALGGALLGGIGGYLHGLPAAGNSHMIGTPGSQLPAGTLSAGAKIGVGLGLAAGAGLLASSLMPSAGGGAGALSMDQIPAYRQQLEAAQASSYASRAGAYPILQIGPQGQNYIAGYDNGPATRRWAEGGGVDTPLTSSPSSSAGSNVSVKIEINNNGSVTSSTKADGGGAFGADFADRLQKMVRGEVQAELVSANRPDGFLTQQGRYLQGRR